ncbi:MAG: hybrid sensor histidine kinase/response regulator [Flavobacteriaceae bacterium]|nr:MAG: hybrid sensor histidine kinase/response regulator [Flavobacteriaceae bacterium]
MNKFKDLKTKTQLLLSFGTVFLLIVAISIVAWKQTGKMALRAENLYNHPLQIKQALSKLESSALSMEVEYRNILLTEIEKTKKQSEQNYQIEKSHVENQFTVLNNKYLGDKRDIDSLKLYFQRWNLMLEDIKKNKNLKTDYIFLGKLLEGDIKTARNLLFNKINVIEDFATNKADQFYRESVLLNQSLNRQFVIFVILALVLFLLIVSYLSKIINVPLKEITYATALFRGGDQSARSNYTSKNEFGNLANSFNEMAEIVETEFKLNNSSASLARVMLKEEDAKAFSMVLLKNLLNNTNSQMGLVYLLNNEKTYFEKFESVGMDIEASKPILAKHPEGIFGLALASRKISHLKNIPNDSKFSFNTINGSLKPREIVTIPIISENEAVAFIAIFSVYNYSKLNIRLLESIFHTLTARMNGILTFKKMVEVSKQLEEQNLELETQKNELQLMADELREQNTELEQQKRQLGEVSRLKTNFLSNMSHELRTPLNSVIALSGVLNRRLAKKIDDEEHSFIGVIERNGKHLLNLINDILDISRIESGKVEVEKNSFNISTLISEMVTMVKPQANQKLVGLNFIDSKKEIILESDYNKCMHILQNIVGNAVKFTEKGSVNITTNIKNGNVYIKINDTGIGMNKEDIPTIFDEFSQSDGSNSRKFGGTGLGLSIAKKYAELINIRIEVKSEQGKGSEFTLIIPLKATYSENEIVSIPQEMIPKVYPSKRVNTEGKTILLVEDTEAMVIQMKDILEEENYVVKVASNGNEALDYLEFEIPDAVILDLMMPGIDGFEVLRQIRNRKQTAELPVLILTAKILNKKELSVIKNNNAHQLIQKGKVTKENLIEAIMLLMLIKEEKDAELTAEVLPVMVNGKPKILVIEDNKDNMIALKALIGEKNTFIEAFDGFEGIAKAKEHSPHLILMDIAMPGKNGFETFRELRKTENLKHIPVIVVTSSALKGDKSYFLNFGFNGYVSKPVNLELLNNEMNKWLITENK